MSRYTVDAPPRPDDSTPLAEARSMVWAGRYLHDRFTAMLSGLVGMVEALEKENEDMRLELADLRASHAVQAPLIFLHSVEDADEHDSAHHDTPEHPLVLRIGRAN